MALQEIAIALKSMNRQPTVFEEPDFRHLLTSPLGRNTGEKSTSGSFNDRFRLERDRSQLIQHLFIH